MPATTVPLRFRLRAVLDELRAAGRPMSQSALAREAGVSLSIVDAIVHNRQRQVSLDTLDALSRVLGVPAGDLLESVPDDA